MTYEDYIASPRWRQLRVQALQRDGYSCRLCSSATELQVHHRRYPPHGQWHLDSIDNVATLCTDCHDLVTCDQRARQYAALSHAGTDIVRTIPAIEVAPYERVQDPELQDHRRRPAIDGHGQTADPLNPHSR